MRNKMAGLRGVQIPHPFGGRFRQMMVYVEPARLQAYGLSSQDVVDALHRANLVMAGGTLKLAGTNYQLHPVNTLPATQDIDNVPIAVRDGRPVFIRDVGYAKDDSAIQYNIVRVNGNRSVYCPLLREPGENTIAVVDRIQSAIAAEIPKMKERGEVPATAEITLVSDQSSYIRNAIRNLAYEVGIGGLLVALVVGVFLREVRPTLVIVASIGLSILSGAIVFYLLGYTINVMTLGGISLAVGTVVDAGIVVAENIIRHLRMGKSVRAATEAGSIEVVTPVLAGTVTTVAVFLPVVFLTGMVRFLFEPLSVAATVTIGASYVVAMTLIPAFCARFLRERTHAGRSGADAGHDSDEVGDERQLTRGIYGRLLQFGIRFRWLVVLGMGLIVAGSLTLIPELGAELFPSVDAGTFEIRLRTVPGRRLEETEKVVMRLEEAIRATIPAKELQAIIANIGLPVPISIQVSAKSLEQCREIAQEIADTMRQVPGAVDVQVAQALDFPQLDIQVDRTKASFLGLSQEAVAKAVLNAYGSSVGHASTIWIDPKTGTDFFMGVQYQTNEAKSLEEVLNLPLSIESSDGPITVPLSNVATVRRVNSPAEVAHYNISRVNDVYVNVAGRDVGAVAADVERRLSELKLPGGVSATLRGPVTTMKSSGKSLLIGIAVASVLVYLVMLAQFRSFIDPLIIMLAVPLGRTGVIVVLYLTRTTVNIQSLMGTLMMIGVVVNNSILLVEFANQLRERGYSVKTAAIAAARIRLRPILMTSLTLVASMAPLTFTFAPGSEAMAPLARAMVGGMLVSTFLTLLLVPCAYVIVKAGGAPRPAKDKPAASI